MKNKETQKIYFYILNKNVADKTALFENAKSEYDEKTAELIDSLNGYVAASGKSNKDERTLTAALLLKSLGHLASEESITLPTALKKDELDKPCFPTALKKDECGKPYFEGSDLKLSISHNENFVAIAYTKGADIGIDIEGEIPAEKAEKLSKRFPAIASLILEKNSKNADDDTKIYLFEMSEDGRFEPLSPIPVDDSFTAKWTAAEALMKCDGRGFSALGELQTLMKEMKVFSFSLTKENKKIYASIAKE